MAEEPLPDWLASMRGQSFDDLPETPLPRPGTEEEASPQDDALARLLGDTQEQPAQPRAPGLVEGLREQMPDEAFDYTYEGESANPILEHLSSGSAIPGLKPWQGLVIAILFCLNVVVCGAMVLAMAGKIRF